MYALYKETHPPTAVEHCVCCSFLRGVSCGEHNLITAAASYLYVYRLKKVGLPSMRCTLPVVALNACVVYK